LKIVYYTSGNPGTGRIVQGISIYNSFVRKNINTDFIIISSNPLAGIADKFGIKHIEIPLETEDKLSAQNYENSVLYRTLTEIDPDVLLVDRMWYTLYNFIDKLKCRKIFFSIQVHDNFYTIRLKDRTISFKNEQYDRVLAIEPFKSSVPMENINPVIIRNRDEIMSSEKSSEELGLDSSKQVCFVMLNYKEGYFEKLKNKYSYLESADYEMIYTTNLKGGGIFPIVDYFNAADLIIGAAGYTTFWECVYFNKKAILETFPLHFSSMKRRMKECIDYKFNINGADQFTEIIINL
jgi:hypothetical protein